MEPCSHEFLFPCKRTLRRNCVQKDCVTITNVPRKRAGERRRILSSAHVTKAPQADAMVSRPTAIVIQNHVVAEAEVAIVIAGGKSVEVLTGTVHDEEAKNVGVTNEGVTTAGTKTKGENEAEARTGEAETKTEKDAAEVAIETESGDEVLIVINLEEEVTERRTGHVVDERLYKTVKTVPVRRPSCVLQCHMICTELDFVKGALLYFVY